VVEEAASQTGRPLSNGEYHVIIGLASCFWFAAELRRVSSLRAASMFPQSVYRFLNCRHHLVHGAWFSGSPVESLVRFDAWPREVRYQQFCHACHVLSVGIAQVVLSCLRRGLNHEAIVVAVSTKPRLGTSCWFDQAIRIEISSQVRRFGSGSAFFLQ
jgi:hypothetical protein